MRRKNIPVSQRIVLLPLILITVFVIIGVVFIDLYFGQVALKRYEKELIHLARSGAQMVSFLPNQKDTLESFDHLADSFTEQGRFRVTIINHAGTVLGDSQLSLQEVKEIENHGERPEILQAKESGIGISRRFSTTLRIDLLYVAARCSTPSFKGYFRVALPLVDLHQERQQQRLLLGGIGLLSLLIATSLSMLISRHLLYLVRQGKMELEQRVISRTKEIGILQNLGTQLSACNSKEEALQAIEIVTTILLPRFTGTLALFRSSKDKLEIATTWNGQWKGEASYSPDQCWALRIGQAHMGDVDHGTMRCSHSPQKEEQLFCVPLIAQGVTLGVLHFAGPRVVEWTSEEKQLAAAIAEHASLTLSNLALRESLRQQAIRDPLTGLYNRRYLQETLNNELHRASRRKQELGLLMIDLDHFKKFNDEHGHEVGDYILSEFGRLVRLAIRGEDIACRYGGEEFTLVLPEAEREGSLAVAEKIATMIREHNFLVNNRSCGPITVSIGVALFPCHGMTAEELFKQADEALYKAKREGRNRVVLAGGAD